MISNLGLGMDPFDRERLLVVADCFGGTWIEELRNRYRDLRVVTAPSYLSAIAELSRHPARAVVACVGSGLIQPDNAVAGLREAAGTGTKVVLCCAPESEPRTRRVLAAGADDYVLYPLQGDELDAAIGYKPAIRVALPELTAVPAASMQELVQLSETLAGIGERPMVLLQRIAALVRLALRAHGATVVVEGAAATSGDVVNKPVLSAPIEGASGVIGQLSAGERVEGPYTPGDANKLTHYARLVGHILAAASKQRQWRQLAVTDECSGLPNRRYLHERLDEVLTRAAAEQLFVTVLLFDLDDFKTYNDTYGHDAGDEIIRVTGDLFRRHCREQDIVARYGGDEFVVVFWDPEGPRVTGSKHPDCALAVLGRFTEALCSHRFECLGSSGQGRLTISGGIATFPWNGLTREALLTRADEALLAAKRAGKNRVFLIGQEDE